MDVMRERAKNIATVRRGLKADEKRFTFVRGSFRSSVYLDQLRAATFKASASERESERAREGANERRSAYIRGQALHVFIFRHDTPLPLSPLMKLRIENRSSSDRS